jgi:23S rRNA (pseudouridine1915-N3)-methyltransferase
MGAVDGDPSVSAVRPKGDENASPSRRSGCEAARLAAPSLAARRSGVGAVGVDASVNAARPEGTKTPRPPAVDPTSGRSRPTEASDSPGATHIVVRRSLTTMRTIVLAVGRLRPPYADDVQHYQKLLARHTRLELVEVREDQHLDGRIPDRAFVTLLASDGESFDSVGFSRFLEQRRQSGQDLCFVIGGPRGLDLEQCDLRLSLGPMTLPHQLARVVLLEQLYRANKIIAGEPYHY